MTEPTEEMIAAAGQYLGGEDYEWTARQVWTAMNAAAPVPPMTDLSPETVGTTPPDDPRADEGLVAVIVMLLAVIGERGAFIGPNDGIAQDARAALAAARSHGGM